MIFLFANAYIATSQQDAGLAVFAEIERKFGDQLSDDARSTYLAAVALLRATYADRIVLVRRIGWMRETFGILEQANQLAEEANPLVHWAAGVIYASAPRFFGKREDAKRELLWLVDRPETEPLPGFYREAYRHLADLYEREGAPVADRYRVMSGYGDDAPDVLFTGWFATSAALGLRMSPTPWIEEIEEGEVFALRGHGFSDIHFIISADKSQLIAIDAGTQPFSFASALKQMEDTYPDLPELTAVLVTHAHWDHVGGHEFIRRRYPEAVFYGRENFHGTLQRAQRNHPYKQLRSNKYVHDWIRGYEPDIAVAQHTEIEIGGSTFQLSPAIGGETEDALLIRHDPSGIVFGGDTLMPFYGEPTVEEGFVREAIATMDAMLALNPSRLLHGHYGITVLYGDPATLAAYRKAYAWLVDVASMYFVNGYSAEEVIRLNLVPPALLEDPDASLGFLAARDHVIRRLGDSYTGIWREDSSGLEPHGLHIITRIERGRALERYFDLSAGEAARAIERMIANGDLELALETAIAAEGRYQKASRFKELRREAADRLRLTVQFFDPFRFTIYTEIAGREHPGTSVE